MSNSRKRILDMLAEKKISVEEAERLLSLIEPGEEAEAKTPPDASGEKPEPKYFRVVVNPEAEAGADRVNVRIPIALVRAGMKLTALIPAHASDKVNEALREKGIDFDISNIKPEDLEELLEAMKDLEVDVESGEDKVHVYVE